MRRPTRKQQQQHKDERKEWAVGGWVGSGRRWAGSRRSKRSGDSLHKEQQRPLKKNQQWCPLPAICINPIGQQPFC